MDLPVNTSSQLAATLRALRKSRQLSQAAVGLRLGVSQKRVARIEAAPGVTSFDQIARYVSTLGARLIIQDHDAAVSGRTKPTRPATPGTW